MHGVKMRECNSQREREFKSTLWRNDLVKSFIRRAEVHLRAKSQRQDRTQKPSKMSMLSDFHAEVNLLFPSSFSYFFLSICPQIGCNYFNINASFSTSFNVRNFANLSNLDGSSFLQIRYFLCTVLINKCIIKLEIILNRISSFR